MTTEQKAKAYDEALKKANAAYKDEDKHLKATLERIFPELAESEQKPNGGIVREDFTQGDGWYKVNLDYLSKAQVEEIEQLVEKWNPEEVSEDEKIKKAILIYLDWLDGKKDYLPKGDYTIKDMILWLEKQGKETRWKPSKEEMDVLYGLAYITNQYDEHKEEVITHLYQDLKREFFNGSSYENMFPNTEDDVRRRSTIQVLEYARSLDTYNQYGKADIAKNIAWLEKQGEKKPEENKGNIGGISSNSEWSEEDEAVLDALIRRLEGEDVYVSPHLAVKCLKSLKGRVVPPQPKQEWSEEDEQHIDSLLKRLDALCRNKFERTRFAISEDRDWLKSLRPQNRWKPSEDDIIILEKLIKGELEPKVFQATLQGILEQLKKLRGKV